MSLAGYGITAIASISIRKSGWASPATKSNLEDFDLATFWREHIEQLTSQWLPYAFTVRANERGITFLKQRILELVAHPDGAGWYRAQINVATVEEARMLIFGLGADGRVIEPPELQEDVLRIARQILNQCGRSFG